MPRRGAEELFERGYRTGYREGFDDGFNLAEKGGRMPTHIGGFGGEFSKRGTPAPKKRKLSAWNKFVKANSKKPRFVYRSGKLNLKKMGVAFRKTPAGRKKK